MKRRKFVHAWFVRVARNPDRYLRGKDSTTTIPRKANLYFSKAAALRAFTEAVVSGAPKRWLSELRLNECDLVRSRKRVVVQATFHWESQDPPIPA